MTQAEALCRQDLNPTLGRSWVSQDFPFASVRQGPALSPMVGRLKTDVGYIWSSFPVCSWSLFPVHRGQVNSCHHLRIKAEAMAHGSEINLLIKFC